MRYRATGPLEQISDGFKQAGDDIFGNRDLIERLARLYRSFEHGTVAVLDGRWGTGKTTFAKAWISHLAENQIPAIYFDAFASDYIDSPFEALASSFIHSAKRKNTEESKSYKNFLSAAAKVGKILAVTTAKVGVKAITLGAIDHSDVKALANLGEDIADGLSEGTEDAIKEVLEAQADRDEKFAALRDALRPPRTIAILGWLWAFDRVVELPGRGFGVFEAFWLWIVGGFRADAGLIAPSWHHPAAIAIRSRTTSRRML